MGVTGDVWSYACNAGYNTTVTNISCTSAGWVPTLTSAQANTTCVPLACDKPSAPANGVIVGGGSGITGDVLSYACNVGYYIVNNFTATCIAPNWTQPALSPQCLPVDCGSPPLPAAGSFACDSTSTLFGAMCSLTCNPGFVLSVNGASAATITCDSNASWTAPSAVCTPVLCPALVQPSYGSVTYSNLTFTFSVASFACNNGYEMVGESVSLCLITGNWSSAVPQCNLITCSNPPSIPNGTPMLSNGIAVNGTVQAYTCDDGFVLRGTLLCTASGWVGSPSCGGSFHS